MPSLAEVQQRFVAALRDPSAPTPVASSRGRFGVHRNNVAAGVLGVLEERFAVVRRIVGDDFFRAMASAYTAQQPPVSPILLLYGATFPHFIEGFQHAADLIYLPAVARLEWLQHEAYHAADATPIGAADLASVPPEHIAALRFHLHPSLRLFASELPALSIWDLNTKGDAFAPASFAAEAEHAAILRPALIVETHRIDAAAYDFLAALQSGQTLGAAAEATMSRHDHFDLQENLAALISMGGLTGYDLTMESSAL